MNSIVFTFGRCNPPTKGHIKLFNKVLEIAKENKAENLIFLSQTRNGKTDPLDWDFKKRVCKACTSAKISSDEEIKTPFQALKLLSETYDKAIMVVGSDQEDEFRTRMIPYAEKWGIELEVVSAGERNSKSNGIAGLSASKLRKYAVKGNKEKFLKGLPDTINSNIKELVYRNTLKGLNETIRNSTAKKSNG